MRAYDIPCPVCGQVNRGMSLLRTGGRLVCVRCGAEARVLCLRPLKVYPEGAAEGERSQPWKHGRETDENTRMTGIRL